MGIRLDGTGYLIHTGKILSALPLTIIAFGTRTATSGDQCWVAHSQSNGDRYVRMYLGGSSEYKNGQHRSPVQGSLTRKIATPHASATVARMMALEVTSPTSRTMRFGDSANPATNTDASGTPSDDIVSHDQIIIGASQHNSLAFSSFTKGDLMEVHFIAGTVSTANYDAMLAGTLMPQAIPGWVDGWTLKDYQPSGTYTSIGGTRTMTAVGGVTATPDTVTHPIARTGAADTTAPVLSAPVGASSGSTTATGSVTTDEGNGTLYRLTSINATETSATIVASGVTQAVTAAGVQNITATGLTASTAYYHHFVHKDTATNTSNVVSSASFTTAAAGDVTAPVLSAQTAAATSSIAASGTVSTNESGGSLYRYVSVNATETAVTVKAAALFQAVAATGIQNFSVTGLTGGTSGYRVHLLHRDAAGNDSAVVSTAAFATPATAGGRISIADPMVRNNGIRLASAAVTVFVTQVVDNLPVVTKSLTTTSAALVPDFIDNDILVGVDYRCIFKFANDPDGKAVEGLVIARAL